MNLLTKISFWRTSRILNSRTAAIYEPLTAHPAARPLERERENRPQMGRSSKSCTRAGGALRSNSRIAQPGNLSPLFRTPPDGLIVMGAIIASRDAHLVFTSPHRLAYVCDSSDSMYRPSIDLFFETAERYWNGLVIGVLLAGIGRYGAEGWQRLRFAGRHTIAQDEASSAIPGMPKTAEDLGAAGDILPLNTIARRLIELVGRKTCLHA